MFIDIIYLLISEKTMQTTAATDVLYSTMHSFTLIWSLITFTCTLCYFFFHFLALLTEGLSKADSIIDFMLRSSWFVNFYFKLLLRFGSF